jgi:hypothetical protein
MAASIAKDIIMGFPDFERGLSPAQIDRFIADGYLAIPGAFSREDAMEGQRTLWTATGCDPDDPATWTKPVIRLGHLTQPPFARAANAPALREAFDQIVGAGRWLPRDGLGGWPIRFPSAEDPGDTGWHVDASFPPPDAKPGDYRGWRVNWQSRGRALLMLFLFSDVGDDDAPTRIRVGSHLDMARLLKPYGEEGIDIFEFDFSSTSHRPEVAATGEAGTVFLCHPLLVHSGQRHVGIRPKFMAQPPLLPKGELRLDREIAQSPVELAILRGIA